MEENEKERRKIVYQDGIYHLLKPKNGNGWYDVGEKKSLHAINDLVGKDEFKFEMSEEIRERIEEYKEYRREQFRKYSSLESKTI